MKPFRARIAIPCRGDKLLFDFRMIRNLSYQKGIITYANMKAVLYTGTVRFNNKVHPVWVYDNFKSTWTVGEPPYSVFKPEVI